MVLIGFITYVLEALIFVNDPINVEKQGYKVYFNFVRFLYVGICIVMIFYLLFCLIQIFLNYREMRSRYKIFFLFSLYFIFTINLCLIKSHSQWKHLYFFPKWRKSAFSHNYKQSLRFYVAVFLHDE